MCIDIADKNTNEKVNNVRTERGKSGKRKKKS